MEEKPSQQGKRLIFLFAGLIDALLGGAVLLIYFGFLPLDMADYGIPRRAVGAIGGIWFLSGVAVLMYQLARLRLDE
jgi:hypothetical protein